MEDARVEQELARRNALERDDSECPVCFDDFDAPARCYLPCPPPCNDKHWLCRTCLSQLAETQQRKSPPEAVPCPLCRAEFEDVDLVNLLTRVELD